MASKIRIFFLVTFLSVSVDQISKYLIVKTLSETGYLPVFRYFSLTLVENTGICFGIFNNINLKTPIILASLLIAIGILFYSRKYSKDVIAFALIEGGIIGNLIDRIRIGAVIDFLDFHIWPVFNLGDTFIVSGVLIILFSQLKRVRYASGVCEGR